MGLGKSDEFFWSCFFFPFLSFMLSFSAFHEHSLQLLIHSPKYLWTTYCMLHIVLGPGMQQEIKEGKFLFVFRCQAPREPLASVQTQSSPRNTHAQLVMQMVQKRHQETSVTKTWISEEGGPRVPEERVLFQEAQKGLKEIRTDTVKATSTCVKAIRARVKPNEVNPRSQKVAAANSIDLPTSFTPSSGNVLMPILPRVTGVPTKGQGQASNQGQAPAQAPSDAQGPTKAPE